jgi:hypothetical protein
MKSEIDLLSEIKIASPCTASWDEMHGDDRVRYCHDCQLNVYNLSAMTRRQAETLVKEKEGRLCVRFYKRRDGTALTSDCPVGFRAARRALLLQLGAIATAFTFLSAHIPLPFGAGRNALQHSWLGQIEPFRTVFDWLNPVPPAIVMGSAAPQLVSPPPVPARGPNDRPSSPDKSRLGETGGRE